mmetsp:Transcript_27304/g.53594  ORF Transcript_27304/g.53594 Transcript_27304/m.53594 type:complete len:446 (+) Transcript_27304:83-1420(+)
MRPALGFRRCPWRLKSTIASRYPLAVSVAHRSSAACCLRFDRRFVSGGGHGRVEAHLKGEETAAGAEVRRRLKEGHPWVFAEEVANMTELNQFDAGTIVHLRCSDGEQLGQGLLNRQASVVLRMITGEEEETAVDESLFAKRLQEALAFRSRHFRRCTSFRVCNGEADGLPGLVVDRLGETVLIRYESLAIQTFSDLIERQVDALLRPRAVVVQRMRAKKEKMAQRGAEFLTFMGKGQAADAQVTEGPAVLGVHLLAGIDSGYSFENRPARDFLVGLCKGSTVLDVNCGSGAFAVRALLGGASEAVCVESSLALVSLAESNAKANNQADRMTVIHRSDVVEEMENMKMSQLQFGVVVLSLRPEIVYEYKQKHGQHGRWHKPSLKGIEKPIEAASALVQPGGVLCLNMQIDTQRAHQLRFLMNTGIERSNRTGTFLWEGGGGWDCR